MDAQTERITRKHIRNVRKRHGPEREKIISSLIFRLRYLLVNVKVDVLFEFLASLSASGQIS